MFLSRPKALFLRVLDTWRDVQRQNERRFPKLRVAGSRRRSRERLASLAGPRTPSRAPNIPNVLGHLERGRFCWGWGLRRLGPAWGRTRSRLAAAPGRTAASGASCLPPSLWGSGRVRVNGCSVDRTLSYKSPPNGTLRACLR